MEDDQDNNPEHSIEIVDADVPVWSDALAKLEIDGDAAPLALLIRNGDIPPSEVLKQLSIMLLPPDGYIGVKLKAEFGARTREGAIQKLRVKRDIRNRIRLLEAEDGKLEYAISKVMEETDYSRATLFNILKSDDKDLVLESQKILGNAI